eukprot:scaffold5157_cov100-Cylindrotheca_fusiformis.AAC.13
MSRGDQRERDRAKRQAKEAAKAKGKQREGTPQQRNLNDKEALLAKLEAKKAKHADGQNGHDSKAAVTRKNRPKPTNDLDDLLSAGLKGGKTKKK